MRTEQIQGRTHDVAAGLLRLFFGSSGHRYLRLVKVKKVTYIHL
jgi:hypothetical protein